ncbi:hypothetical protein F5Y13DRAFT_102509 [Hypoxylon sp. FL1857]|nr:hypothetical protein F5Y13DRAFT_102509 [Hypoxylon sp. FL1857]
MRMASLPQALEKDHKTNHLPICQVHSLSAPMEHNARDHAFHGQFQQSFTSENPVPMRPTPLSSNLEESRQNPPEAMNVPSQSRYHSHMMSKGQVHNNDELLPADKLNTIPISGGHAYKGPTRVSQACNYCRRAKSRCDGRDPCQNCMEKSLTCEYQVVSREYPLFKELKLTNERLLVLMKHVGCPEPGSVNPNVVASTSDDDGTPNYDQRRRSVTKASPVLPTPPRESSIGTQLAIEEAWKIIWESDDRLTNSQAYRKDVPLHHAALARMSTERKYIQDLVNDSPPTSRQANGSWVRSRGTDGVTQTSVMCRLSSLEDYSQASTSISELSNTRHGDSLHLDCDLFWNRKAMRSCIQSFRDNILSCYPLISPRELEAAFTIFLDGLFNAPSRLTAEAVNSRESSISNGATGQKRKRSATADEKHPPILVQKPTGLHRTEVDALVLLVLALGQICIRKGKTSDATPGPDYFALAINTGLVNGYCPGDMHVYKHVRICILASLYYICLGRTAEGRSYIAIASQNLARFAMPCLNRLRTSKSDTSAIEPLPENDNLLLLSFWICVQLEREFSTELALPPSDILRLAILMRFPDVNFLVRQGFSEDAACYYMSQLYLRKESIQLNSALLGKEGKAMQASSHPQTIERLILAVDLSLEESRRGCGIPCQVDIYPADLLNACFCARYWDTKIALYERFLKIILEREPLLADMYHDSPSLDNWSAVRFGHNTERQAIANDPRTVKHACRAIFALVRSVQAFSRVNGRRQVFIAGMFTTPVKYVLIDQLDAYHPSNRPKSSHCKHLLMLAACYKSAYCREIVRRFAKPETLNTLFMSTIHLFQAIVHPDSALAADMNILLGIAENLTES